MEEGSTLTIHKAYSQIAYLRYVSFLRSLPSFTRGDLLTSPALSTLVQSVSCLHILYFMSWVQLISYANSHSIHVIC